MEKVSERAAMGRVNTIQRGWKRDRHINVPHQILKGLPKILIFSLVPLAIVVAVAK